MSVYIIAEVGVNHNGDIKIAKKLIDEAKKAGVDCVKFQTFIAKNLASKHANKANYQVVNTKNSESQADMLKKLELSFDDFKELKDYCDQIKIDFMSTAFDFESFKFLVDLDMAVWKIPSGDITNLPYLVEVSKLNKPLILSTGMSTLNEVIEAYSVLKKNGSGPITVLHCTTEYPAPMEDVNLNAMLLIKDTLDVPVGYSDHTEGIEISLAAVALGAKVIEKHFTLSKNLEGPDHKASIEPDEFSKMVKSIRNIESALGTFNKSPAKSEIQNLAIARKSIVAKNNIKKGDIFTESNVTVKRPGNGISPMKWFDVLGTTAKKDFYEDDLIEI